MIIFHNFEHPSLPTSLIKQKKSNWARNYMWDYYHFVQLYNKPPLNLSKILGKRIQTAKSMCRWRCFWAGEEVANINIAWNDKSATCKCVANGF